MPTSAQGVIEPSLVCHCMRGHKTCARFVAPLAQSLSHSGLMTPSTGWASWTPASAQGVISHHDWMTMLPPSHMNSHSCWCASPTHTHAHTHTQPLLLAHFPSHSLHVGTPNEHMMCSFCGPVCRSTSWGIQHVTYPLTKLTKLYII